MGKAFRPASGPGEVREQLQRLRDGLRRVGRIAPLGRTATASEVSRKVNQILAHIDAITRDGEAADPVATVVVPEEGGNPS